jgi:hypothetical protein
MAKAKSKYREEQEVWVKAKVIGVPKHHCLNAGDYAVEFRDGHIHVFASDHIKAAPGSFENPIPYSPAQFDASFKRRSLYNGKS